MGTDLGAVKARDFKRLADPLERWNKDAIMQMKGTPWEPIPGTKEDSIPVHVRLPEEEGNHKSQATLVNHRGRYADEPESRAARS